MSIHALFTFSHSPHLTLEMAPPLSAEMTELVAYFKSTGLADRPSDELARSKPKDHTPIVDFFKLHKLESRGFDEAKAALAFQGAKESVKLKLGKGEAAYIIDAIADGRLDIAARVTGEWKAWLVAARTARASLLTVTVTSRSWDKVSLGEPGARRRSRV